MTVSVTGMFLYAGYEHMRTHNLSEEAIAEINKAIGGDLEVARELVQYAVTAEKVCNRVFDELNVTSSPGIWEYEVADNAGAWFAAFVATEGRAPNNSEWEQYIEECTRQFIEDYKE